jgi:CRP-like cAMP-binding protein
VTFAGAPTHLMEGETKLSRRSKRPIGPATPMAAPPVAGRRELKRIADRTLTLVSTRPVVEAKGMSSVEMKTAAQLLAETYPFSQLSASTRSRLLQHVTEQQVAAGSVVSAEGDAVHSISVIGSGRVQLRSSRRLEEVGERCCGELLGELAAVTGAVQQATIIALEPTLLYVIRDKALFALARAEPTFGGLLCELALMQDCRPVTASASFDCGDPPIVEHTAGEHACAPLPVSTSRPLMRLTTSATPLRRPALARPLAASRPSFFTLPAARLSRLVGGFNREGSRIRAASTPGVRQGRQDDLRYEWSKTVTSFLGGQLARTRRPTARELI